MKRKTPPRKRTNPHIRPVDPINPNGSGRRPTRQAKVGPFLNLLITQLREKEAKPQVARDQLYDIARDVGNHRRARPDPEGHLIEDDSHG